MVPRSWCLPSTPPHVRPPPLDTCCKGEMLLSGVYRGHLTTLLYPARRKLRSFPRKLASTWLLSPLYCLGGSSQGTILGTCIQKKGLSLPRLHNNCMRHCVPNRDRATLGRGQPASLCPWCERGVALAWQSVLSCTSLAPCTLGSLLSLFGMTLACLL